MIYLFSSSFSDLIRYMTSGPCLALALMRRDAISHWRFLLGPTDCAAAREDRPDSIRARFGVDKTTNAAHGSDSEESAKRVGEKFSFSSLNDFSAILMQ